MKRSLILLLLLLASCTVTSEDKNKCRDICGDDFTLRTYTNVTTKIFCECRDFLGNGIMSSTVIRETVPVVDVEPPCMLGWHNATHFCNEYHWKEKIPEEIK